VAAVKRGAFDFVEKPFSDNALVDRIEQALAASRAVLESRREQAAVQAAAGREALLRLSREAGEHEAQWARAEQTRRELEAGLEARSADERDARQQVAGIEAEVSGLSAGLTGLLESESSQRERVVELQKRMNALKEEVATGGRGTREVLRGYTAELLRRSGEKS